MIGALHVLARAIVVSAVMLALEAQVLAVPPLQFSSHVDFTFRARGASALCGFDVFVHIEGTGRATLFYDSAGTIVSENDSQPDLKVTVFAPSTGKSFTFAAGAALHTVYNDGGVIGSTGIAIMTGVFQRFPGAGVDAGRTVFQTLVIDITPEGIPVTDFTDALSHTGSELDSSISAARCDAVK